MLPELPDDRKRRLMNQYNISLHDVMSLMHENGCVEYFEEVVINDIIMLLIYHVKNLISCYFVLGGKKSKSSSCRKLDYT